MVTTIAKPTALTRNCALAVQVSDRMPPRMANAAMSAAIIITPRENETGRTNETISTAILISATSRSAVGGSCMTLAATRKPRERKRWPRKLGSV